MLKKPNRIGKELLDSSLKTEIEGKLDKSGTIDWSQITNKPQLSDGSWKAPVSSVSSLPVTGADGEIRLVLDTNNVYTYDAPTSKWELIGANDMSVDWNIITGKPSTFAPSTHTHTEADITNLDKYTKSEVDTKLSGKSNTGHTHAYADITGKPSTFTPSAHTHVEADITNLDKYTKSEVDTKLSGKANTNHTHTEADITNLDKYTKSEVDTMMSGKSSTNHTHAELHSHSNKVLIDKITESTVHDSYDLHKLYDFDNRLYNIENGYTEGHSHANLTALNKISYSGTRGIIDLKELETNASAISGHVDNTAVHVTGDEKSAWNGKADASHTHDDRYYTETEVNNLLSGKAASSHTHDDRYYTETEVNNLLSGKADTSHTHLWADVTDKPSTFTPSSHTHDDRYYTETEVNNLLGGKANTSHTHDDRYYTETEMTNFLNGKANTSHTHTKSDITDFPTSLPASGGNADTVDNKHAADFAPIIRQQQTYGVSGIIGKLGSSLAVVAGEGRTENDTRYHNDNENLYLAGQSVYLESNSDNSASPHTLILNANGLLTLNGSTIYHTGNSAPLTPSIGTVQPTDSSEMWYKVVG